MAIQSPRPTTTNDARSAFALWAFAAAVTIILLAYGAYKLYTPVTYVEVPPHTTIVTE